MTTPLAGTGDFTPTMSGVPSDVLLDVQPGIVIAPGVTQPFGPYLMAQPAYSVYLDALSVVAGTVAVVSVVTLWQDPVNGFTVATERWYYPAVTAAPASQNGLMVGRGPTKSAQLTLQVKNYDPAQSVTVDLRVWQSSRTVNRDDWRSTALTSVGSPWQTPNTEARAGILGYMTAQGIAAAGGFQWLCGMYAGQATLSVQTAGFANCTVKVYVPLPNIPLAGAPFLYNAVMTSAQLVVALTLPRCPVVVEIDNGGGAAITVSWSLTVLEFAS